jgi:ubiquitin carboxyl-terminal hydrolase 4/11/15
VATAVVAGKSTSRGKYQEFLLVPLKGSLSDLNVTVMSLLSPAASPSSKSTDLNFASRKRQRSQSMQSDSSTSIKRAASEGPSATPISIDHITDTTTSAVDLLQEHDNEIDAYMAEQGYDVPLNTLVPIQPPPANLSIEQKAARIQQLRSKPMVVGDTWYIISRQWFKPWAIACGILSDKTVAPLQEEAIGPPDNSSLFDVRGNLTSTLVEGVEVEFLPQEAWSELVAWCVSYIPLPSFLHLILSISGMVSR